MSNLNLTSAICPSCGAKLALLGSPQDFTCGAVGKLAEDTNKEGKPKTITRQDLDAATADMVKEWEK